MILTKIIMFLYLLAFVFVMLLSNFYLFMFYGVGFLISIFLDEVVTATEK